MLIALSSSVVFHWTRFKVWSKYLWKYCLFLINMITVIGLA